MSIFKIGQSRPSVQRVVKAAEIAGIETTKAVLGYALTKDPFATTTQCKVIGDFFEWCARAAISSRLCDKGQSAKAAKVFLGNPLNLVADAFLLLGIKADYNNSKFKVLKQVATVMFKKPYAQDAKIFPPRA